MKPFLQATDFISYKVSMQSTMPQRVQMNEYRKFAPPDTSPVINIADTPVLDPNCGLPLNLNPSAESVLITASTLTLSSTL